MHLRYKSLIQISQRLVSSECSRPLTHGGKLVRKPTFPQSKPKAKPGHSISNTETHIATTTVFNETKNVASTHGSKGFGFLRNLLSRFSPGQLKLRNMACSQSPVRVRPVDFEDEDALGSSSRCSEDLSPPSSVKGMVELDRDQFKKTVRVPGIQVPMAHIATLNKLFKDMFLKMPGLKPLASLDEYHALHSTHKLFLLDPRLFSGLTDLSDKQKAALDKCGLTEEDIKSYELELDYKNWTYQEILKVVLPESSDSVAGFSTIGHIIHLNLRDEILSYKDIIGKVLLDKVPTARTVVNKLNNIDNTFRNFEMDVLAGDDDMLTTTKEHGFTFKMDFSKVYWNPRLGTEHHRVVGCLSKDDVVYDVFAGVGPFAIPAAKKRCTVLANDLNPHSHKWLQENTIINKVSGSCSTYNLDGREFIKTVVKDDLLRRWAADPSPSGPTKFHVVMNLPALAVEFLDALSGLFEGIPRQEDWMSFSLPRVYCYCFTSEGGVELDTRERLHRSLGEPLADDVEMRFVRKVAPNKNMMCVVFELPETVLFGRQSTDNTTEYFRDSYEESPPAKRSKPEQ